MLLNPVLKQDSAAFEKLIEGSFFWSTIYCREEEDDDDVGGVTGVDDDDHDVDDDDDADDYDDHDADDNDSKVLPDHWKQSSQR